MPRIIRASELPLTLRRGPLASYLSALTRALREPGIGPDRALRLRRECERVRAALQPYR